MLFLAVNGELFFIRSKIDVARLKVFSMFGNIDRHHNALAQPVDQAVDKPFGNMLDNNNRYREISWQLR